MPLATVEKYDPRTNTWSTLADMSVCRGGAGLAALCGRLYVVGGHDGSEYLSSVECFDPSKNVYVHSHLLSIHTHFHSYFVYITINHHQTHPSLLNRVFPVELFNIFRILFFLIAFASKIADVTKFLLALAIKIYQ